jgi:hypothetical protein
MRARPDQTEAQIIEGWRSHAHLSAPAGLALAATRRDPPSLSELAAALDGVVAAHTARSR